jgi:hypothetical protein
VSQRIDAVEKSTSTARRLLLEHRFFQQHQPFMKRRSFLMARLKLTKRYCVQTVVPSQEDFLR